jgi:hypothetical protein
MRREGLLAGVAVLAAVSAASAGQNKNYMVPVYAACPGSGNCTPPTLESTYTFDTITLSSSQARYTGPGKFAVGIVIKGLKDAGGNPVTANLELRTGASRITILSQGVGTLGETSPLVPETVYVVPVKNGSAKAKFNTPDNTPANGLIVNSLTAPVLYDPEGKPLASTGTQAKP